jgi:hypothetical protein
VTSTFQKLVSRLRAWENLGTERFKGGARHIGHVPHVAEFAYLHTLCAPLSETEIDFFASLVKSGIPADVRAFYAYCNGFSLFSSGICMYGLTRRPANAPLVRERADLVPFDGVRVNTLGRAVANPSAFIFAVYRDGTLAYSESSGAIHLFRPDTREGNLQKWHTFEEWLLCETDRLAESFDAEGRSKT